MTSRRQLLSVLGAGVTAGMSGCFGFNTGCNLGYNANLIPVAEQDIANDAYREPPTEVRSYGDYVLRQLAESPDETRETLDAHRLDEETFVRVAGTYYRVTRTEGTTSGLRVTYVVRPPLDDELVSPDLTYEELPQADREALLATPVGELLNSSEESDALRRNIEANTPAEITLEYLTPDPTPSQLADGEAGMLEVNGVVVVFEPYPVSESDIATAVVGLETVATTPEEAAGVILNQRSTTVLEDVSESDAEFLQAAIKEDQMVCESDPDPDQPRPSGDLRETLDEHRYVKYQGQWYDVDFSEFTA